MAAASAAPNAAKNCCSFGPSRSDSRAARMSAGRRFSSSRTPAVLIRTKRCRGWCCLVWGWEGDCGVLVWVIAVRCVCFMMFAEEARV